MSTGEHIGVAAAIAALRQELLLATESGKDSDVRFRITAIDLSLHVAATKEGNGKIGWTILGLGASYESATTQTLKLALEPMWRTSDGSSASDFAVSQQNQLPTAVGPES